MERFCSKCGLEWPLVEDVARVIADVARSYRLQARDISDIAEDFLPVRLQVTETGWHIWEGDPGYDTDHQGWWGADSIPGDLWTGWTPEECAADLIEQAQDAHHQEG